MTREPVQLLAYHTTWKGGSFSLNAHAAIRWVSLNQMQEIGICAGRYTNCRKITARYDVNIKCDPLSCGSLFF